MSLQRLFPLFVKKIIAMPGTMLSLILPIVTNWHN